MGESASDQSELRSLADLADAVGKVHHFLMDTFHLPG